MLFDGVALILPEGEIGAGRLRVENGLISELGPACEVVAARPGETVVNGSDGYLLPGFIDLHIHGALGRDAMEGSPEAFREILRFHASGGTTALALTSVAAPQADLLRLLEAARAWKCAHRGGMEAALLGIHVEGPYFAVTKAGAHRLEYLRLPSASETAELLAFSDVMTQMTLAPELPGALELISALRSAGIIASGGHSDAWDEEAGAAFARGMDQVTHTFNAMSGARRRGAYRAAGLLEFALAEPGIRCELIADGHHVSPTLLRLAYRAKGAAGICLVTDASPGTGLAEGSRYRFAGRDCIVQQGVGLTQDASALAGSVATSVVGVRNMVRLAGVPLAEAVRMATLNPARALRLDHERGHLAPGLRADMVLLDSNLEISGTWVGGSRIFPEAPADDTMRAASQGAPHP